jgi:hypothetical protein
LTEQEHLAETVEHLQRAAIELIAAARSTLDLLEDAVSNPGSFADLLARLGQMAEQSPRAERARSTDSSDPPRVQHIPVR